MQKSLVFISHISEEKEIAQELKRLVKSTFLGMIDVFVSSDPTSIAMGHKWLSGITEALKHCAVEIILASPKSVNRPWINFESGCGWIRDIPVIPLCHSGMIPEKLPAPLNSLQAATASEESELTRVFQVLAKVIGSALPQIDFRKFVSVVKEFESTSRQYKAMIEKLPIAATDGLSPQEFATLVEIADSAVIPGDFVGIHDIRSKLGKSGVRGLAVTLALQMLTRKDLVETSFESRWNSGNDYPVVRVSEEGWNWLESNKDKLMLTEEPSQEEDKSCLSTTSEEVPF